MSMLDLLDMAISQDTKGDLTEFFLSVYSYGLFRIWVEIFKFIWYNKHLWVNLLGIIAMG